IEGSVLTWAAQHQRHHAFADSAADPHSPWRHGSGLAPQLRGLWHVHLSWLFLANPSDPHRWIPDLLADGDLQLISRTATLWSWLLTVLPFFRVGCSPGPPRAPCWACCGPAGCASSCCITGPGR